MIIITPDKYRHFDVIQIGKNHQSNGKKKLMMLPRSKQHTLAVVLA